MRIAKYLCALLGLVSTLAYVDGGRILAAFVFPGKSHFMMHKVLIKSLLERGHQVTFITAFPMEKNLGENYTEILIEPVYDFWSDIQNHFGASSIFELTNLSFRGFLKMLEIIGETTTEHALKQPKIKEIFNRTDTKDVYDLLIAEQFFQEAFLTLGLKYDIPVITSSTLGFMPYMSQMMGIITPWSFVPHTFLPFDDRMTFWERVQNTLSALYDDFFREYLYFPKQDALVKKYLSHLPFNIPKVSQMEKNVSGILLNNYVPLSMPNPSLHGLIDVGGMHIYPPKPLPADIKQFLDGATHGAIYFSMGSNVRSADLPPEKLKMILRVFSSMKQRVLWKFENENIAGLPKNVMVKNWLPQNDILGHRNIKVFITHGGLFGSQEGVYHGVPMLGMPIYCDQFLNMNKATKAGYAITMNYQDLEEKTFKKSLMELLENPVYKKNVERISAIFRDRPMSARDTAMYWVDYIIRHKGAPHLQSAGRDLAWYEFYLLDVIGLLVFGVLVVFLGILFALKKLLRLGSRNSKKVPKKKTN